MTHDTTPAQPDGAAAAIAAEEDLPPTPAAQADLHQWAHTAGWSVPFVDIARARPDEWGGTRMVAAEVTEAGVVVTLDNGQVFRLAAEELTHPSGRPAHPFTLNPAGQEQLTHADALGNGAPLCGYLADGETASPDWSEADCRDCQAAAPGANLHTFDSLDHATAERQVRDILIAASPQPLPLYAVMRRTDRRYRAGVRAALDRLAGQGRAEQLAGTGAGQPSWRAMQRS